MFLLMALSEVFLLLGWVWKSDCLCSPTTFYKNCWIRRFPGLSIDVGHSQRRGGQVLKAYPEATAEQCSRTCCLLKNVSCNLAVFYYETNKTLNCLHVYCPALESCILRPSMNVVLYNITLGIDPDLLVFEKLSFKDLNTRSSFNKWERHGSARVADSEKCQNDTTNSRCLPADASSSTVLQELVANSSNTSTEVDSIHRTPSITHLEPTSPSPKDRFTKVTGIISEWKDSTASSNNVSALPTSQFTLIKMLSHMPSPAHLNSSKHHLNETKGYNGRNYTSDNEGQKPAWEGMERGSWLFPLVLSSSIILICCCTILGTGCCRKRSGRYKPRRRGVSTSRQFIRYTMVKHNS
ncbi:MANSC domain-containing protein 4 [Hemicordylus capensis]|uniref:MANSC domain-containing protein 4 n=1 Tax=Hemicordylus capensis TaxID=884348 RepID=UPI002302AD9F|nr:MANSC domain-containing protein 4 [Hemicordylus capensis]XP_053110441.1 MANSC domain-containing protein 4 [Hemicordylus capensis]XP_053110442.1 MANSC domain-containing protein 4 [Hemicordylus capensis]XP_053110443.1 MANSC domain-containing protein 4 [Hemicordylus capensis]XP_053110444.1 MANSC domain-containing protein 4 [Hemicordylus capensis]XP_053110445.1 MANSC domain-containing protein 4 [Hemicordylus capensis]XP_053110446.1 MANSC domain-containing protein 4 [Hemicordylus capensis]XP_0